MADTTTIDTVRDAAGGRFERFRVFLAEVRNEGLKNLGLDG